MEKLNTNINKSCYENGRKLVWGYDFSQISDISKVKEFHQKHNKNAFNRLESDNRLAIIGGDNFLIEDGKMKLKITRSKTDGYRYDIPMTVSTRDTMSFLYGYMEIEAEIPYEYGVHAAWWTIPQNKPEEETYRRVCAEFDMFEVNGRYNPSNPPDEAVENEAALPVSNLHKWYKYKDENGKIITTTVNIDALNYDETVCTDNQIFGDYTIADAKYKKPDGNYMTLEEARKKHKYGLEWNPQYIAFSIDGVEYFRTYISEGYDFYRNKNGFIPENSVGMNCFHDAQNILLTFCTKRNGNAWAYGGDRNNADYYDKLYPQDGIFAVTTNGKDEVEYNIYSIKLYQREGETFTLY